MSRISSTTDDIFVLFVAGKINCKGRKFGIKWHSSESEASKIAKRQISGKIIEGWVVLLLHWINKRISNTIKMLLHVIYNCFSYYGLVLSLPLSLHQNHYQFVATYYYFFACFISTQ